MKLSLIITVTLISSSVICVARPPYTLSEAAGGSNVDRVKEMLTTGKYDGHLNAALCRASQYSTLEMVKTLVDAGADVNTTSGGKTPMHCVADRNVGKNRSNGLEIAKYLVSKGAEIDPKTSSGETPLYMAAGHGSAAVGAWLLEQGADPHVKCKDGYGGYATPLMRAASKGIIIGQSELAMALVHKGADVNVCDSSKYTPLHYSVTASSPELAKVLIDAGADVNALSDRSMTSLHITSRFMPLPFPLYAEVADLLLKAGADPFIKDKRGRTAYEIFERDVENWQGNEFDDMDSMWSKGLSDAQIKGLKKWRKDMPKLLKRAEKRQRKIDAKQKTKTPNSIQDDSAAITNYVNNSRGSYDAHDNAISNYMKIGLLVIALLAVAGVGIFAVRKNRNI